MWALCSCRLIRLRGKNRLINIMGWVVQVSDLSLILIPAIMNARSLSEEGLM